MRSINSPIRMFNVTCNASANVSIPVTRSHKLNDRDHVGLADGTADADAHLPRYFAKSGFVGNDPKKTKKEGSGKGNWGREGDEVQDYDYNMTNPRRRSNSFHQPQNQLKTKFETIEAEPVFEEELHGAPQGSEDMGDVNIDLEKESTNSSSGAGSVDEEDVAKKI